MLAIYACHCSNSELKARRLLKSCSAPDYLSIKCYTGKNSIFMAMDNLPSSLHQTTEWGALKDAVSNLTSYSIIVGWDEKNLRWSNVYDGRLESVVPAEKIIEYFAKND